MQPRTLESIISELDTAYSPAIANIRKRQAAIPGTIKNEEGALKAQEQDYYDNTIMADARRRGLGFGGISLGERARYGATQYLPALARLRQQGQQDVMSLEDSILGLVRERNNLAQSLRSSDMDRSEQMRQFNESLAEQRRQFDAQQAVARSGGGGAGGGFAPTFGGVASTARSGGGGRATTQQIPQALQSLFNQMFIKGDGTKWGDNELISDYNRTKISAGYGNTRDKQKLQLYHSVRPDLFGSGVSAAALANGSQLRF